MGGHPTFAIIRGPCSTGTSVGAWRSLVARIVRDDEVGGSNPLAPTKLTDLAFSRTGMPAVPIVLGISADDRVFRRVDSSDDVRPG